MNKPVGVVIIAVLEFLAGLLSLLGGLFLIVGGSMLASFVSHSRHISDTDLSSVGPILAGLGAVLAIMAFFFAVIWAVVGWGMWSLKNWARITTMVLCGVGIGFALLGLLVSLLHFHLLIVVWAGLRIFICALVIAYLLQPQVKAAFEGRPPAAA